MIFHPLEKSERGSTVLPTPGILCPAVARLVSKCPVSHPPPSGRGRTTELLLPNLPSLAPPPHGTHSSLALSMWQHVASSQPPQNINPEI